MADGKGLGHPALGNERESKSVWAPGAVLDTRLVHGYDGQQLFVRGSKLLVANVVAFPVSVHHRPGLIEPCLPTNGRALPAEPHWAYEIKHDRFRFICPAGS